MTVSNSVSFTGTVGKGGFNFQSNANLDAKGIKMVSGSFAVNGKGDEETVWFSAVAFGDIAVAMSYANQGDLYEVNGEFSMTSYQGKPKMKVLVRRFKLVAKTKARTTELATV